MKESEAREKWCPMTRFHATRENVYHNKLIEDDNDSGEASAESANCIGSDCMMWRWNRDAFAGGSGRAEPTKGYCGLGGKP